jgi:putative ABC transport system permease protein
MGVLWFKIMRDLWGNLGRTLQVVLIIGLGATAIGMIMGTRDLVIPGMEDIWLKSSAPMITLYVYPPVSEETLQALKRVDGVNQIEGFSNTIIEWRKNPVEEWRQGGLTARADYEQQQLLKLELVSGEWPQDKVLSVEQGSDTFFGIPITGTVYLRVNKREAKVKLDGVVYNPMSQPALFGGTAQFYAPGEYYERLVGSNGFDRLLVTAARWDETAVTALANRLQDKLKKQGVDSGRQITNPNKHFFQDQMDGLFFLLGALGAVSLALGLLIVYNTMNALISRQVNQIGIMKALGARTGQVLRFFLIETFVYGFLAMFLAVPLGVMGAYGISSWLVGSFGADIGAFQISTPAVITMVAITLAAPLAAALFPIWSGARITVREAISTYGLSTKVGLIERLGARLRWLSRMVLITVSNTFRNGWRVALMQTVLVLSGLIFMMVVSLRDSVVYTVDEILFKILNADVTFALNNTYRIETLEEIARAHPLVRDVETWAVMSGTIRPVNQPESEDDKTALIFGVPLPTQMYGYQLRAGRWLESADSYAIVLNKALAEDVGVTVGDWVTVKYGENRERNWQVVGLVFDNLLTTSANVPRDILLHDINMVGKVSTLWLDTTAENPAGQIATAKALREYFKQNHIEVSAQRGVFSIGGDATVETAQTFKNQFNFILVLLGMMALIIGAVGGMALSGTLGLSVQERTNEIGIMRAIGASSWSVARLFIGEGLILGWLSWLIALPLSMPAGRLMVAAMGQAFGSEYVYHYTPAGAALWLIIITILSILASWLPARSATRISVRESLAYQ